MRRDLDRLAWAWMLLAGVTLLLHPVLVALAVSAGWLAPFVLPVALGLAREVVLALLGASLLAFVTLPALLAFGTGIGLLERRAWAPVAAIVCLGPALLLAPPLGLFVGALTVWTLWDSGTRAKLTAAGDAPLGWRVGAVVRLHDKLVSETSGDAASGLDLGQALPAEEGGRLPMLAWSARDRVALVDDTGAEYVVDPQHPAVLRRGSVAVAVSVMPELRVRRWAPLSALGSLVLLAVFLGASVGVGQGEIAWRILSCPLLGVGCPQSGEGSATAAFTAEYLARLLREDYAGQQVGVMDPDMERPEAQRKTDDPDRFYIPAGNRGPITKMGGAEEVAPDPVRAPESEEEALPVPKKKRPAPKVVVVAEDGSPAKPEVEKEDADDGVADADQDTPLPELVEEEDKARPAEEKQGWGVQDWYDEQDQQLDDLEIRLMIKVSRERLKIDPNDPSALSVLSYYQYLAEDYAAAEATYDKYIAVLPEDAAGYNNKALVYKRRGEYSKEEGLYRLALAFEPDDVTAMNNLGVNLAHQKRFPEALRVMRELEVLDPGDPYADLHRSKIHAEMGDDAKALEYLEKALRGMAELDTLHHIEFRQDIRLDPSYARLRETERFRAILLRYYGKDSPLQDP